MLLSVPVETKQSNSNNSLSAFAALSLAPSPEPGASFQSSPSSIVFSLDGTQYSDSATDFGTETTDSGGSAIDNGESNEVVRILGCQVLSLLNDNLELAARLVPKIHDLLREDVLGWIGNTNSQDDDGISIAGYSRPNGMQQGSGSSGSPQSRPSYSGSSSGKHGRASRESRKRNGDSNSNKRSRRGRGRGSGNHPEDPDESDNGDPAGNPVCDHGGSSKDNEVEDAFQNPDKMPGDPDGDPGSDPSINTSVRNSFNFACHFYKFDPTRFTFWTDEKYEKCPGSRITQLRHIKYHFKMVHTQPSSSPFCRRCFRSFQNIDDLDNNAQEIVPCNPTKKPSTLNNDIDEDQWKEIDRIFCRKGQKHVDNISRWYEIWQILFPGVKKPPHPWVEPPGYKRPPTCDIKDFLSKFEARVAADETLQAEEQIRSRYLHHLRQQILEEVASCRTTQTEHFRKDQEDGVEFTNFSKVNASNYDHASSIGGDDSNRIAVPREWGDTSNSFFEEFHEESHNMGPAYSPRHYTSDIRASIFESSEPSRAPFAPCMEGSAFGDQNLQKNFSGNWEYPQRDEKQHATSMKKSMTDQRDGNYIMGDELVAVADLLELENQMRHATAPWRDKNSGNRFLGHL